MILPHFEHRLFAGYVVTAVSIEHEDSFESMGYKIFDQSNDHVQIDSWRTRKCSGEVEMVV